MYKPLPKPLVKRKHKIYAEVGDSYVRLYYTYIRLMRVNSHDWLIRLCNYAEVVDSYVIRDEGPIFPTAQPPKARQCTRYSYPYEQCIITAIRLVLFKSNQTRAFISQFLASASRCATLSKLMTFQTAFRQSGRTFLYQHTIQCGNKIGRYSVSP